MILSLITNDPIALLLPTNDQLEFEFNMIDTNVLTKILGIQITIKGVGKNPHICHKWYIQYISKWFNMENYKSITTHVNSNSKT
jgi:hypothetical protein